MKKLLLLLSVSLFSEIAMAQTSGGPDAYGYIWRDSYDANGPAYTWIDITGLSGTVDITDFLGDDNISGPYPLDQGFPFYWYSVNQFWIGSNGYIRFPSRLALASPFPAIPDSLLPNNYLAVMTSDLFFGNSGNPAQCMYWQSPNEDTLVVSWINVPFWDPAAPGYTGSNTFQAVLSWVDSSITYNFQNQSGVPGGGQVTNIMTVGIESKAGIYGLQHSHDIYPVNNYSVKFYFPQNSTLQVNDATTNYNLNPVNGAVFVSRNGDSLALVAEVANGGNIDINNPFNVSIVVRNTLNQIQVSDNQSAGPLVAGQVQTVQTSNKFAPVNAGQFRMQTETQLSGDNISSNNRIITEIQVVDTTLSSIELAYDNGIAGAAGISWNGGNGGTAAYFIPPFYPCNLNQAKMYIVSDPSSVGYIVMVHDDDGTDGLPGTLLDSIFVAPGTFSPLSWVTTTLNAPVTINSGGVYITWYMAGPDVSLGRNATSITNPSSNRMFETLDGVYSSYRFSEIDDVMIRAVISKITGVSEIDNQVAGTLYPNPASSFIAVDLNAEMMKVSTTEVKIYSAEGSLIMHREYAGQNKLQWSIAELPAGVYVAKIINGDNEVNRKFTVIK